MADAPDHGSKLIFDGVTLTAVYTGNEVEFSHVGPLSLAIAYTNGDETSIEIELMMSYDGITYFAPRNSANTDLSEIFQFTATVSGIYNISEFVAGGERLGPILIGARFLRVSLKATAGTPTGTASVTIIR